MSNSTSRNTSELESNLQEIITALCGASRRCTICYDDADGDECCRCMEYYLDCTCKPLTSSQIENNEHPRNCIICNKECNVFDMDLNQRCEGCAK